MLKELSVENVAIIENAQVHLESGFTVLTGETGAGKSLLIDALELVLGERADSDLVRTGTQKATVHAAFDLSERTDLKQRALDAGLTLEDGILYVHREVFAEGRSTCRIGGKLCPIGSLKQIGTWLVDLHGQHDHQSLLDPLKHVHYLDSWIGDPAFDLLRSVSQSFHDLTKARAELSSLRKGVKDREQRIDMLNFQVQEIESAGLVPGELADHYSQLSKLKNLEKITSLTSEALATLSDGDTSALDALQTAIQRLESAERLDEGISDSLNPIKSALYHLEDGLINLRNYSESLDPDPNSLEFLADRVDLIKRLARKYADDSDDNDPIASILDHLNEAQRELAILSDAEESELHLTQRVSQCEEEFNAASQSLSNLRHENAGIFSELVQSHLRDLALDKAVFSVKLDPKVAEVDGIDRVEFMFSANPGEPQKPLHKVASGGEASRVMLSIKSALAGRAGTPTLIFDEIDSGLSGRAAASVATKISELSKYYQVIAISHLPQIASKATNHHRIEKQEKSGRILTQVRKLSDHERIEEIARMLAGDQVTEPARGNARELLGMTG